MALSAASPFYRGFVSDNDCRWGVISASVDDRTQEERGLKVSRRRSMLKEKLTFQFLILNFKLKRLDQDNLAANLRLEIS